MEPGSAMSAASPGHATRGPLGHDFTSVFDVLAGLRGERIVFCPNGGNAGDSFINLGCYLLFEAAGIEFELYRPEQAYAGRVVVRGGGGSLVPPYVSPRDFVAKVHREAKLFILLPHTARVYSELFGELGDNCILFAREDRTRQFMEESARRAHVRQCHDVAFYVDTAPYRLPRSMLRLAGARDGALGGDRRRRALVRIAAAIARGGGRLSALRADDERTTDALPAANVDISGRLFSHDMSPEGCRLTTTFWVAAMSLAREIVTNRLHVGVAAGLLGKPCIFYDNSYGKCADVYEYSMTGMAHVRFQGRGSRPG